MGAFRELIFLIWHTGIPPDADDYPPPFAYGAPPADAYGRGIYANLAHSPVFTMYGAVPFISYNSPLFYVLESQHPGSN